MTVLRSVSRSLRDWVTAAVLFRARMAYSNMSHPCKHILFLFYLSHTRFIFFTHSCLYLSISLSLLSSFLVLVLQYELAQSYHYGRMGHTRSPERAVIYMERSAIKGYPLAQLWMSYACGYRYSGLTPDGALAWCERAMAQGLPAAKMQRAYLYGRTDIHDKAPALFKEAIAEGCVEANIGLSMLENLPDLKTTLLKRAVAGGCETAAYFLYTHLYRYCQYVPDRLSKAHELEKTLHENDSAEAKEALLQRHTREIAETHVRRGGAEIEYKSLLAKANKSRSFWWLWEHADCYEDGDTERAIYLWRSALEAPPPISYVVASLYHNHCSEAHRHLGSCYEQLGNREKALFHYSEASTLGHGGSKKAFDRLSLSTLPPT